MFNLLPKDTVFYDFFEGLARHAHHAAEQLRQLAESFPDTKAAITRIRDAEHAADDLAHQCLDRLDRTFITPFDREDIHALVGGLDDIIDTIDALAKRFALYHVRVIEAPFKKQADLLVAATETLCEAVYRLRKSRKLSDLQEKLIEVHRLESESDDNHYTALSDLYDGRHETLHVIKWKEFYEYIEHAIDACEDVTNILERIVLKNG